MNDQNELSLQDILFLVNLLKTSQLNAPYVQWGPVVEKLENIVKSAQKSFEDGSKKEEKKNKKGS